METYENTMEEKNKENGSYSGKVELEEEEVEKVEKVEAG